VSWHRPFAHECKFETIAPVPGLMLGSGMPILNAIGSSLFSVGSFGLTTAVNYALSGLIDWTIALLFVVGCNRWRHSRHAFREPPGVKPAHAYLHLCGRRLAVAIDMLVRTGFPAWLSIR